VFPSLERLRATARRVVRPGPLRHLLLDLLLELLRLTAHLVQLIENRPQFFGRELRHVHHLSEEPPQPKRRK
jgi:hypothetical protein